MAVANTSELSEGEAVRLMTGANRSPNPSAEAAGLGGIALSANALTSRILDGIDIELATRSLAWAAWSGRARPSA
jgi:hypothetical protein